MKNILLAIAMFTGMASHAQIQSASLTASGLTCSMCSKAIYKALLTIPSIHKVDADIETSSYTIEFNKDADVSPEAIRKAVEGAGFGVARLAITASVPKTTIETGTRLSLQGATYKFIRPDGKTVQGVQTFTVIGKSYLSAAEWKKYAKDVPAKKEIGVYLVAL